MRYYKTLGEKARIFISGDAVIDKFSDLIKTLDDLNNEHNLFRGQPEAKLKLYSSLQRLWIGKRLHKHYNSYNDLVNNLIRNSREWNSGLISRYLKNSGWQENEMSILSIMQHYGVPTPLLDFTYDFKKSLFFATENLDIAPPGSEIEKYFSIYYIFKNNPVLTMADKEKKGSRKDLETTIQYELVLIDNTDEAYRIQNNLNILNQEGAFIFNSSPTDPLEIHYLKYAHHLTRNAEEENIGSPGKLGGCININKKLSPEIREFLRDKGIDRYSMFPDLNQLRTDCLNVEWKKI